MVQIGVVHDGGLGWVRLPVVRGKGDGREKLDAELALKPGRLYRTPLDRYQTF